MSNDKYIHYIPYSTPNMIQNRVIHKISPSKNRIGITIWTQKIDGTIKHEDCVGVKKILTMIKLLENL